MYVLLHRNVMKGKGTLTWISNHCVDSKYELNGDWWENNVTKSQNMITKWRDPWIFYVLITSLDRAFSKSVISLGKCLKLPLQIPRSGELRTQKLKSHLVRTQSLNVLLFKPGVGQYIAIHATLTTRDFFLAYFYPSSPFTCIFSKTSPNFFLCWPAEWNRSPCWMQVPVLSARGI